MSRSSQLIRWLGVVALVAGVAAPSAFAQGQGRLAGRAVDETGEPLAGVTIKAEKPDANPPLFETTTDDSGRFSLIGFVSGQWSVSATLEGYTPDTGVATIRQGQNAPINFVLTKLQHELVQALGEEAMAGLDPDAVEAELEAADAAYNAEDWDTAIQGYSSLLEKLPMLTNLQLQIGNSYRAKGEHEQALAAYEALLAGEPDNETVKAEIARTKLAMGDFESASAELEAAASGLNASREDLYNLGELEFAKGEVDTAAQWYEKASMVDPNWGLPLFKLALVALNKGEMDSAKEYFQKVIDVDPNSAEAAQAKATLDALP
jgi:tetratricopeptide (TPR) repeat protein